MPTVAESAVVCARGVDVQVALATTVFRATSRLQRVCADPDDDHDRCAGNTYKQHESFLGKTGRHV